MKKYLISILLLALIFATAMGNASASSLNDRERLFGLLEKCEQFAGFEITLNESMMGIPIEVKRIQKGLKIREDYEFIGNLTHVICDGIYRYTWSDADEFVKASASEKYAGLLGFDHRKFDNLQVHLQGETVLNGFKCEHYVLDVGSSMYWDFYISVDYDVVIGIDVMLMQILVKDLRETYIDDAAFELPEGMEVKFAE